MTKINSGMALTVKVNADRNRAISHAQRLVVSEPIKHRLRVFNDHKVEEFIRYIDRPMRQIKVRAVIVETSRGNLSDLTVDWKAGAGAVSAAFSGAAAGFMNGVPNLSSNSDDFTAFIRYIESNDNAEILSRPELTILHGQDGLISVGQELPFVTGSYTTESDSSDKPFQTIERKDVGLSLFVQPHIGANGNIDV
ncbi:TPA: type II secretion system protein GspD [Vibrio parahaemolyticus]